ncbi:nuclear transport factor 2 family protein [Streptomyces sp. NPDC012794]|uniref:nuclear transport factor 2 family protein n=1 Tax=Streptomyces sp. NPDC012794 TaxID=3364850 RepID=UPI00369BE86D
MSNRFGVLADILEEWRAAFGERRVDDIVALFADDALFQGLSPRLLNGRAEIRTYYENVPPGTTATVEVLHSRPVAAEALGGFATVTFRTPTPEDLAGTPLTVRLSVLAQHTGDGWRIRQYHVSRLA